jgi:hypothetical protein
MPGLQKAKRERKGIKIGTQSRKSQHVELLEERGAIGILGVLIPCCSAASISHAHTAFLQKPAG